MKINSLPGSGIGNVHIEFEIKIIKKTEVLLKKPCRVQTDGYIDLKGESSLLNQLNLAGE